MIDNSLFNRATTSSPMHAMRLKSIRTLCMIAAVLVVMVPQHAEAKFDGVRYFSCAFHYISSSAIDLAIERLDCNNNDFCKAN